VVSYDIVDDKTRNKIAKTLLDYGTRVQYSVFECVLTKEQLHRLEQELTELYDPREDTIRIYTLCENCLSKVHVLGLGKLTEDEDVYVV